MNEQLKKAKSIRLLFLILSYAYAYYYIRTFPEIIGGGRIPGMVFALILAVFAVIWLEFTMYRQKLEGKDEDVARRAGETRFWEAILILLGVSVGFGMDSALSFLMMHLVTGYMVVCGTGHLFRGVSSCYLPGDLLNAFARIPFGNFPSRIMTVIDLAGSKGEDKETGSKRYIKLAAVILIILTSIVIFFAAFQNLSEMDKNFKNVSIYIENFFRDIDIADFVGRVIFSIPVGMFLHGLFSGSAKYSTGFEARLEKNISSGITRLRIVANAIFGVILSIFIIVYIAFFVSQASYMFSAFAGVLPEEYTASRYAVTGFHELINVVIINFVLLTLVRLFCSKFSRFIKTMLTILMAESLVFSAISASKIILYMSRFGYTESRTLGLWGTAVVFVGSILASVNILTSRKTMAIWLWFSAASFVVTNFIASFYI